MCRGKPDWRADCGGVTRLGGIPPRRVATISTPARRRGTQRTYGRLRGPRRPVRGARHQAVMGIRAMAPRLDAGVGGNAVLNKNPCAEPPQLVLDARALR